MQSIIKINENGKVMRDCIYIKLKKKCLNYEDLDYSVFNECCNSTYIIACTNHSTFRGVIACRRVRFNEIENEFLKYHPQNKQVGYRIEVLHYNKDADLKAKIKLIRSCLADKNDSFVVFEPKCPNTIEDIETVLKPIGFEVHDDLNSPLGYILVKPPLSYPKRIKSRYSSFKIAKQKRR